MVPSRDAAGLNDVHYFIKVCRNLVRIRGRVMGALLGGGLEFGDGGIVIREKADSSLVITYYYGDSNGRPTVSNPVIMIDGVGSIYRCHPEWIEGISRIQQYLDAGYQLNVNGYLPCPYHFN